MMFGQSLTWSKRRQIYQNMKVIKTHLLRHLSQHRQSDVWTASEIRQNFLKYFVDRNHLYVHSSSVVPRKDEGSYFVNAGMNQFKPVFLGTVDPNSEMAKYRRVVNSQKCIRVGGKHNDLEDVGRDTSHHTFFEMLGSWSFGDYFKHQACELAWNLLTDVYRLPKERLYVTYFGGNEALNLQPDIECKEIWFKLGVAADHILPFGTVDNFWDMGDTGPCGPCTEIHYDRTGHKDAGRLVNTGDPSVIELWNLVFMQFDRQPDGSLLRLPSHHVDTGMGLERLTAVLQNKTSNYDTDLFQPLFTAIQQLGKCPPYRGTMDLSDAKNTDTAYRIVADHTRMFTVAMADGVRPGRSDIDSKLRLVLNQSINKATQVLQLPRGGLAQLIPHVIDSLGVAFPEICKDTKQIQDIVNESEDRYLNILKVGTKLVKKVIQTNSQGNGYLDAASLIELQDGRWGTSIPLEVSCNIAENLGISQLDVKGFEAVMDKRKEKQLAALGSRHTDTLPGNKLQQHHVTYLQSLGVSKTIDLYKYMYTWDEDILQYKMDYTDPCEVLAICTLDGFSDQAVQDQYCGLVLDKTSFYAEGGGQKSDIGSWISDMCTFEVSDVQITQEYILHTGRLLQGKLACGDRIVPRIDQEHRTGCSMNHTATHLLNFALEGVLGGVKQQGSSVTPNKLMFDFTCNKTKVKAADIEQIIDRVRQMITDELAVYVQQISIQEAKNIQGIKLLHNEVYPSPVRVLSIGVPLKDLHSHSTGTLHSAELCAGTHVKNTEHLGDFAITHFHGMQQGTKRVVAVTGQAATQAMINAETVHKELSKLQDDVKHGRNIDQWQESQHKIESMLTGQDALTLPKLERDDLISKIDELKTKGLAARKNKDQLTAFITELESLMEQHKDAKYVVGCLKGQALVKQMVATINTCQPPVPILLISKIPNKKTKKRSTTSAVNVMAVLAVIPEQQENAPKCISAEDWMNHIINQTQISVQATAPVENKKLQPGSRAHFMTFSLTDHNVLERLQDSAKRYIDE